MELIQSYGLAQPGVPSRARRLEAALSRLQNDGSAYTSRIAGDGVQLTFHIPCWTTYNFMGRVNVDLLRGYFSTEIVATDSKKAEAIRTASLVRLVLQVRQPIGPYGVKVHPATGVISCGVQSVLPPTFENFAQFVDLIEDLLRNLRNHLKEVLTKIRELSNQAEADAFNESAEADQYKSPVKQSLQELKKFVMSSSGYAWRVLRHRSQKLEKSRLKQEFRQHLKVKSENTSCLLLPAVCTGPIEATHRFFPLTDGDDQHVRETYVQRPQPTTLPGSKQMIEISLTPEQLERLFKTQQLELPNGERLRLRELTKTQIERETLMQEILVERYPTLPQYYYLKGIPELQQRKMSVRSNPRGLIYSTFVAKNSTVLSMVTVLQLLNDMVRTLMFLRDRDIVSNSLQPSSVLVTEGLQLQMDCLWNSYNTSVNTKSGQEEKIEICESNEDEDDIKSVEEKEDPGCRNSLPYISHSGLGDENGPASESSDVFSFGMMMFLSFFRRSLFDIKSSSLKNNPESETMMKMCKRPVFAFDKLRDFQFDHMRMLSMLMLKAASHCVRGMQPFQEQKPTESCSWGGKNNGSPQTQNRLIERRPHLDWVVAVVEHCRQYFQSKFVL